MRKGKQKKPIASHELSNIPRPQRDTLNFSINSELKPETVSAAAHFQKKKKKARKSVTHGDNAHLLTTQ